MSDDDIKILETIIKDLRDELMTQADILFSDDLEKKKFKTLDENKKFNTSIKYKLYRL